MQRAEGIYVDFLPAERPPGAVGLRTVAALGTPERGVPPVFDGSRPLFSPFSSGGGG